MFFLMQVPSAKDRCNCTHMFKNKDYYHRNAKTYFG